MASRATKRLAVAVILLVLGSTACILPEAKPIAPSLTDNGAALSYSGDVIEASGFIEAQEVSVVAETGGRVAQVLVDEASPVTAGQVVVVLDDALLQAARAQAGAAVTVAEANLADLLAGPTPQEVTAAQAAVDEAQANLDGARLAAAQAWATVANPHEIDVQIAQVRLEIDAARQQIDEIQASIAQVEYELRLLDESDVEDPTRHDTLTLTRQGLVSQLAAAQAQYNGAVQRLQLLQAQRENPLVLIAQAHQAQSQVAIAEAQLQLAQAQYDALIAGPLPAEVAIAQGQIDLARAQVALIDAQISRLSLTAPISGVVITRTIAAGETASPGVPLLTIADLSVLRLVVYIPETEIGLVRPGAPVEIVVDAYPGEVFSGEVVRIGREAEFTPRNVQTEEERVNLVFAVEIRIVNPDGRLKPGMPADAAIQTAG